jgi:CubicO group peptidase (beta-lactamase class C family)
MRRLSCVVALMAVVMLPARSSGDVHRQVDAIFGQYDKTDSPGCGLGVIRNGEMIYERGYGMANLEYGIPISSESIFRIGSTSKQFTALSVLLLEEQGKLSLDDDIRKYLPELPDYGTPITIRYLIHHTSGLRDYLDLMDLAGRGEDSYRDEEVVDALARQKELNFPPGEEHLYSNSGYFLLSQIVLRVTGKSLREFAAMNIFRPLGMKNTHFHNDHTHIVKNRAVGYAPRKNGGFRISMTVLDMIGDGGVFTSVRDLLLWDRNFYDNRLGQGGQALIKRMITPGVLNNGTQLDYAFGLRVARYRGLPTVSHGGSFVGYRAEMLRFPEERFTVICLCNVNTADAPRLARQVADVYLADKLGPASEAEPPRSAEGEEESAKDVSVSEAELKAYVGRYYSEELDVTYQLVVEEGKLFVRYRHAPDEPLRASGRDKFHVGSLQLEFERNASKEVVAFKVQTDRVRNIRFVRTED